MGDSFGTFLEMYLWSGKLGILSGDSIFPFFGDSDVGMFREIIPVGDNNRFFIGDSRIFSDSEPFPIY